MAMAQTKRQISDEEVEEEIIASSNQRQSSASKRPRLNGNSNGHATTSSPGRSAAEPTHFVPPEDSDESEEEELYELGTPAPGPPPSRKQATSRKGSALAKGNGNVEMQEDDDQDQGYDEDAEGEEEGDDEDRVREQALKGGKDGKGLIAEAGVLKTVHLKNFMCHANLEVHLNPQINFIIGHNGSGKSVVLTGITFAFGGKAAATNRAKNIKGYVKEGASHAEVTVSLRNKGPEAYRPDLYGETIWITRRISAEAGGTSYKLQNSSRKTVSTSRKELSAICDHFQIQVENPVNILHQDMAKLFLHSSKPQDKYKFFLKGTYLEQLLEEYALLSDQIESLKAINKTKKDRLEDLKTKMKEAHASWKEIEQAKNVEQTIRRMKNELAWTHVVEVEKSCHENVTKQLSEQDYMSKIGKRLRTAQKAFEDAKTKREQAEESQDNDASDELAQERNTLSIKIKEITTEMKRIKNEQREMNETIAMLRENIKRYDLETAEAQQQMEGPARARVEQARTRLRQVEQEKEEVTAIVNAARAKMADMTRKFDEGRSRLEQARGEQKGAQETFERLDTYIRNLDARQQDPLNAYGPHAAAICAAIQRQTGWQQKPIGPIGTFVKLKEQGQQFSRTLENVFGDRLNGFLCTNDNDRRRLGGLIQRFRGARHNIYTVKPDETVERDLVGKLPNPQRFTTIMDVITIEHPFVRQALISIAHIESSILVVERREGDEIMVNNDPRETFITTCFSRDSYTIGGIQGGRRMQALPVYRGAPRMTKDVAAERNRALEEKRQAELKLQEANVVRANLDRELAEYTTQKRQAENDAQRGSARSRKLDSEQEKLIEESREYEPPNLQAITQMRTAALEEIEGIRAQGAASQQQLEEVLASGKPYVDRREEVANILNQREEIMRSRREVLHALVIEQTSRGHEVEQIIKKQQAQQLKVEASNKLVQDWQERLQEVMDAANSLCAKEAVDLSSGKSIKKYEQNIASLEKALRQQEARFGGTSEEVHARYMNAKKNFDDNKRGIDDIKACATAMQKAYEIRMNRWAVFRQHIALRCRMLFIRFLSQRGYTGDLRFRHDSSKLELRVVPSDDNVDKLTMKSQRVKDSSTLSGGEKSFSTICLLLALWSAAGCPIRGLDEYDVFMDAVNRNVSTNMLIDAGRTSNNTQMILISPQAIQGHVGASGVKIIRIADPERGQGTLAANTTG